MLRSVSVVLGCALATASPALAKEYQVAMVNRSADGAMAFTPGYLKIAPGDSVRFVPRDKGHNAESLPALAPPGAPAFKGAIDQELVVKFAKPGLYGYKCVPHYAMGMVGLIQVGPAVNKADVVKASAAMPPFAKARMSKYLAQAQ